MTRQLTCIVCPRGCPLTVTGEGEALTVTGNSCPRGETYAIEECVRPRRTVTSSIRVENRADTMVSVKTAEPIPKGEIFALMAAVRAASVRAPVRIGDVLIENVCGTNVVATREIL
jgi:CxxC motif-containing protein